jgi:hypothetical protein
MGRLAQRISIQAMNEAEPVGAERTGG